MTAWSRVVTTRNRRISDVEGALLFPDSFVQACRDARAFVMSGIVYPGDFPSWMRSDIREYLFLEPRTCNIDQRNRKSEKSRDRKCSRWRVSELGVA